MQSEEEAILTTKLSEKEKTSKKKSQHVPKTAPYIDLFHCLHFHLNGGFDFIASVGTINDRELDKIAARSKWKVLVRSMKEMDRLKRS